jgi:hypothetical protein
MNPDRAMSHGVEPAQVSDAAIKAALDQAVAFLRRSQLPHGEFRSLIGLDMQLSHSEPDSSPFVTTFVLYALNHLDHAEVRGMAGKALDFIEQEMEYGGVWRYYGSRQYKHCRIPPDLDDTACATYALRTGGRATPDNTWVFRYQRDAAGRYRTWIVRARDTVFSLRFWFTRAIGAVYAERLRWRAPRPTAVADPRLLNTRRDPVLADDVDPVVNANVILLLGETAETTPAIHYLVDLIRSGLSTAFSPYYPNALAFHYMVARAHRHSAPALAAIGESVTEDIVRRQSADGSFGNALPTALATSALLTFAPQSPGLPNAIASILRSQRSDGSWDKHAFYCGASEFWGSEELTTALCIEALARWRMRTSGNAEGRLA